MPRRSLWFAASLVAASSEAATTLTREVDFRILADGRTVETVLIRARLDSDADRAAWSPFPIALDDNKDVDALQAAVERPDGSLLALDKKAFDTVAPSFAQILHHSQRFRTVSFPASTLGSVYRISYRLTTRPYFAARSLYLPLGDATERLRVTVHGPSDLRFSLDGSVKQLSLQPTADGFTIGGDRVPALETRERAAASLRDGALLRLAWGPARDWAALGDWYAALVAEVPRAGSAGPAALGLKGEDDRATIAKALEHVRRSVRYVAVEVGIGGFQPRPPQRVRELGWGDCKDKALLLIDTLAALGIDAYPALIRASREDRVDPDFPSVDQFNHLIVAVPSTRFGTTDGLAHAGGYVFLDPTQEVGGLEYFPSYLQGQSALVARAGASRLVATPATSVDGQRIEIEARQDEAGAIDGRLVLTLEGGPARAFSERTAGMRSEEQRRAVEALLRVHFPAGDITAPSAVPGAGEVPTVVLSGALSAKASPGSRSVALAWKPVTPPLALLENRELALLLDPGSHQAAWRLELPTGWCAPPAAAQTVDNAIGRFDQSLRLEGRSVVIERSLVLRRRWVEIDQLPALRELVLAEHRARARSLRFDCTKP